MAKLTLPPPGSQLTYDNFAVAVDTAIDTTSDEVVAAKDRADAAYSLAESKSAKPAAGWALSDLSAAALAGLVQTDGTVLRAVKLTQAAYDALTPKVATTLYVIVG